MKHTRFSSKLLEATQGLIKDRPRAVTLQKIADDTGLPLSWLERFSAGKSQSAVVGHVEKLYEYLSGQKLEL